MEGENEVSVRGKCGSYRDKVCGPRTGPENPLDPRPEFVGIDLPAV